MWSKLVQEEWAPSDWQTASALYALWSGRCFDAGKCGHYRHVTKEEIQ
jgi:hypothetical protein